MIAKAQIARIIITFGYGMMGAAIIVMLILPIFGYSILESKQHLTFLNLAYFVSIVTNIFGHMCMYCAVGEILTAKCDRIHYAVYFNEWYTFNARNSRDLVLLMLRTNKPLHLHFGKLFPLTMATFCSLLKTSAGYISVLLTTRSQ
ncbi:PREDICTED: uncharacterized protein LOC108755604 [Trachymyrmex septentrionalis]|uniref:uncharacterized protein LOC108755604 n=1 Tax=Trachymyrmex septentrionalis TaxID=34720 RepID=UPI00084F371B|nr:PREDICTED: uncharacterized protein LOC108755604 [Trachymyrmex septentrionalis]